MIYMSLLLYDFKCSIISHGLHVQAIYVTMPILCILPHTLYILCTEAYLCPHCFINVGPTLLPLTLMAS